MVLRRAKPIRARLAEVGLFEEGLPEASLLQAGLLVARFVAMHYLSSQNSSRLVSCRRRLEGLRSCLAPSLVEGNFVEAGIYVVALLEAQCGRLA